jgi:hypothetical protein
VLGVTCTVLRDTVSEHGHGNVWYYVKGVGEVKEQVVKGHHEQFELVSVTHPSQR